MAKTYNKMQIDMNGEIHSSVTAVAQDTLSRYLDCYLFNNGVPIDLDGHMVQLYVNKPDKTTIVTQGEITEAANGRVQFELTNQTLAVPGWLEMQIVLLSGNTEVLSSHTFKLFVISSLRSDEAIESTNEFGALVVLFQDIQNALDVMNDIVKNFGEPGEIAKLYNATTFWSMLENVVGKVDVVAALKSYVNSTIGTSHFMPIDQMISSNSGEEGFIPLDLLIKSLFGSAETFLESGTFTVPQGVTRIKVVAVGGGGGGGGGAIMSGITTLGGGGGGGGGACIIDVYTVSGGQTISITVGKGGAGGYNSDGADGTATVVGNLVTAAGGVGGDGGSGATGTGGVAGGSGGGAGANGDSTESGSAGLIGAGGVSYTGEKQQYGGGGGGSYGEGGDAQLSMDGSAENGVRGGGGGGAYMNSSAGKGGDGIVMIEWGAGIV